MVHFFRDILDGPVYIIVAILSLIFIIAIIGFMLERKQLEREKKNREAVFDMPQDDVSDSILNEVPAFDQTADMNIDINSTISSIDQTTQYNEFANQYTEPINNPYEESANHYVASANRANNYMNSTVSETISYDNGTMSEINVDNTTTNDIPSVLDFDAIDRQQ